MSGKWDPKKYQRRLSRGALEVIEEKVESGGKEIQEKPKEKKPSTKVIDLVAVLQQSLAKSKGGRKKGGAKPSHKRAAKTHKKAA